VTTSSTRDVQVLAPHRPDEDGILTPEALEFLGELERRFGSRRRTLLEARRRRQQRLDQGERPDFLAETRERRASDWTVAPAPSDLQDRRVEITGPVERKMIINALNSGARVFMADFEDSNSPTWENVLQGQRNLYDAIRRTIDFEAPNGKHYKLNDHVATLIARPRGWHLEENRVTVEGLPMSASLFDFGLYFFHNAHELVARGSGPYFYLPKLESHLEARLWNEVFEFAQERRGLPRGTIKATVLIETILAAFEMDEILWELREHSAGLNCGRWDYIFSFIKRFKGQADFLLPDRAQVTMTTHFLRSYAQLVVQTCHRRGIHAIGGMAAQIPVKGDPEANDRALAKVRQDKEREAADGHDGTWVAHPALVPVAMDVFDDVLDGPHQIHRIPDHAITAEDLLMVPEGTITAAGLRANVEIGLIYLASWLEGKGCVPIHHLMEDAATAEISRTQLWQWIRHPQARLDDGRAVDEALFRDELSQVHQELQRQGKLPKLEEAMGLYERLVLSSELEEFLTISASEKL